MSEANCQWCGDPVNEGHYIGCARCRVRRQLRPCRECGFGNCQQCSTVAAKGLPCGCNCRTADFDPTLLHIAAVDDYKRERVAAGLAAWITSRSPRQLALGLGAA